MCRSWLIVLFCAGLLAGCSKAGPPERRAAASDVDAPRTRRAPPHNPKELGWVRWHRDYEQAAAIARRDGRPLFLLFQEVPGCSTCVGFGESVLSHPLVIEAIETAFVPIAVHNNEGGADRRLLQRFGEPSWNNPVVRFVDARGRDLIARADGVWSTHGIAQRMIRALQAAERPVPSYLTWAVQETAAFERATFAMGCYWRGEACLGAIPGVVRTRAGWLAGREVVEVDFHGDGLTESALREAVRERGCGEFVGGATRVRDASDGDQKYHLRRSRLRWVPLTPLQASRVNAALARGESPLPWLSPRQKELAAAITAAEPSVLGGLSPPRDPYDLAGYEQLVRARLSL